MSDFNGLHLGLGNLSRLSRAKTRSISAENFTGEKGKAGMATEGTGKVVAGKSPGDLLPSREALPGIRLRERPQVPSGAVVWISGNRSRRELADCLRAAAGQPVRVGQRNE